MAIEGQAQKTKTDLQSKDRTFVHRVLLGILHEVLTTREKDHLHGTITFFHTPEGKKKDRSKTMSSYSEPVGAHLYKHSVSFESTIPKKKPLS